MTVEAPTMSPTPAGVAPRSRANSGNNGVRQIA